MSPAGEETGMEVARARVLPGAGGAGETACSAMKASDGGSSSEGSQLSPTGVPSGTEGTTLDARPRSRKEGNRNVPLDV